MPIRTDAWVVRSVAAVCSIGLVCGVASAQEHLRRAPANEVSGIVSCEYRFSPDIGGGLRQEAADHFEGVAGWRINRVEWWGGYLAIPGIVRGNPSGFTFRFYADDNGTPGARLYQQSAASFTETEYHREPPSPPDWPDGFPNFHYTADLPVTFVVPTTGRYWMSIVALYDEFDLDWGWTRTTDAVSSPRVMLRTRFNPVFSPSLIDDHNAFALYYTGTTIPCPADLDDGSGTGTPDGGVTIDDLVYFVSSFAQGDMGADLDDDGLDPGTPDGGVTIDDLIFFFDHFGMCC
jgi:hypothetical protein